MKLHRLTLDQQILRIGQNHLEFKFNKDADKFKVKMQAFITECGSQLKIPGPIAENNSFFEVYGIKEVVPGQEVDIEGSVVDSPYVKLPDSVRQNLNRIESCDNFGGWL